MPVVNPDGFNSRPRATSSTCARPTAAARRRSSGRPATPTSGRTAGPPTAQPAPGPARSTSPVATASASTSTATTAATGAAPGASRPRCRPDLPRCRPVLGARDPERPRADLVPAGHDADHQPHLQQPRAAAAGRARAGARPRRGDLRGLGARMAAQNGYRNQQGWQLYDTTGTTEDWSYSATGGYGYTFEIGPDEFHPPYEDVIDQYLGTGGTTARATARRTCSRWPTLPTPPSTPWCRQGSGRGHAATAQAVRHADLRRLVVHRPARHHDDRPGGRQLLLACQPEHPSARHEAPRQVLAEEPTPEETFTAGRALLPNQHEDKEFVVTETDQDLLQVELDGRPPTTTTSRSTTGRPTAHSRGRRAPATSSARRSSQRSTPRRPGPTSCASSTSRR